MTTSISRVLSLAIVAGSLAVTASADLLFDRGLPGANLNNGAGASRSNVAWGDTTNIYGDDFTLGGVGSYSISTIRTWIVGGTNGESVAAMYNSLQLMLGSGLNGALAATAYTYTATLVSYPGGTGFYEGSTGTHRDLWQIDWNTTGLTLNGGVIMNFALLGDTSATGLAALGYNDIVFLHSSNAALSGTPQQGANGLMNEWTPGGANVGPWTSFNNGWDKASDGNIQVFGAAPVPEPFTMMLGAAGAGLFLRRRSKKLRA